MTLSQKISAGFIACTIIMVTVAFFSFRNSERFIQTSKWVNHTHEVLREFDLLWASSLGIVSGSRGYVITGDEKYLDSYYAGIKETKEHLQKVKALTKDNPTQQKSLQNLEETLDLSNAFRNELIEARAHGSKVAYQMVSDGDGKRFQEEIKSILNDCERIENNLLNDRQKANENESRNFNAIFVLLLFVIALVLVAMYAIITTNLKALKKAERESNEKNWLLTGNFELNETMRGEREVAELSQSVVTKVCKYLNAQIGAIYIYENGVLRQTGTYAFDVNKTDLKLIKPGEGLVGQAAREKKAILFNDVPDHYIKVNSGLGESSPKNLLYLPLIQDDVLKGVIELGATRQFSQTDMDFLNMISENVGIVLGAAQSRTKLKELLEETQRQAEELEAQQEELKQSNEELTEKTSLLEKSGMELKAQQEELQQANEELEEKANLLEAQKERLEQAKSDIEHKARELEVTGKYKSEFLANMSHELRTPLNSILILSQLLAENKNQVLGSKETEFAKNIYNSGTDLLKLINEILDLSKVESGKMELDIEPADFEELTHDVRAMFDEVAKSKAIDFEINLAKSDFSGRFTTDKQRLEQVLRNLLSNAFKFTGKGGKVQLSIYRAPLGIEFRNKNIALQRQVIAFEVKDTGIGIAEEKLGIVFEAFQQADGTTKRKFGGTGLGLSISRELANVLGGEIQVESEENVGSKFTLYLPAAYNQLVMQPTERLVEVKEQKVERANSVARVETPESETADDRYHITPNEKCVLIIEDDVLFADVLLNFVRKRGYKGIVARQGNTGLSYARQHKPDAILLDMSLPVMDGTEVLKHLKNDPELRHIPVQIISGQDKRKEGLELGAFDFIRKPVSSSDLQNAFARVEEFVNRKLRRLLVVEDNETQNKAIRELIGDGDVKSFSAYSGEEAYRMLQEEHYDCAIVDLGLPDMSGFDLLEKIKGSDNLNRTPVVVYTGRDLTREENARLSRLASAVVLKTANSQDRLLDETILFLHRVESKLPKEKQNIIRKLHKTDEVLRDKKVLVVDDDIRNIYSLTNALEEEGVLCLTAENGKEAIAMLRKNPSIDIILMDVMMPEMDGYEATREIRNIERFSNVPIIALTAKAMKGDREKCLSVGMSDYVSKPVNVEQLISLMRVWLYK